MQSINNALISWRIQQVRKEEAKIKALAVKKIQEQQSPKVVTIVENLKILTEENNITRKKWNSE